ncbi:MAG TPA: hypothetical protein VFM46_16620, partial [Pseudomonadales bacterium]|nr:hypothetical protein [Pseudomonadales bacterium]
SLMEKSLYSNKVDHLLEALDGVVSGQYLLRLTSFYQNDNMGVMEFKLSGYSEAEIHELAQNIKKSTFIMKEIADYLCGDIE